MASNATVASSIEVRPSVLVPGYASLRIEIPKPEATDEEIDAQVERLRQQFGELTAVDRPAIDGDHVTTTFEGSVPLATFIERASVSR